MAPLVVGNHRVRLNVTDAFRPHLQKCFARICTQRGLYVDFEKRAEVIHRTGAVAIDVAVASLEPTFLCGRQELGGARCISAGAS